MSAPSNSQPRRVQSATGAALANYATNGERAAAAIAFMIDCYAPTDAQEALIVNMQTFQAACAGRRGVPLPGRAFSEPSQAGKSRTIAEFARRANAVHPANPLRVVHVELSERITLKMLYQRILCRLGDPEAFGKYSTEVLRQRCAELLAGVDTELLAIDEVQLLGKQTRDNYEVADALKGMLDSGTVGILFAGNEKAKQIFEVNEQLRGRLGVPMQLAAANPKVTADLNALKRFATALDDAIAASGLVRTAGLGQADMVRRMGRASGGRIGRFSRIVGAALEHACARGAERIEALDLSYAVRHLAIPAGWTSRNPFPEPAIW